jgi:hypothetical protein
MESVSGAADRKRLYFDYIVEILTMRRTGVALIIFVWVLLAPTAAFSQDEMAGKKGGTEKQEKKDSTKTNETKTKSEDATTTTGGTKTDVATTTTTGTKGKANEDSGAENLPAVALGKTEIYEKSLAALTMLFVIAVLLESAFALLFSWRVFLTYFSVTGVKTIVMLLIAWIVVYAFDVDILASLINVYREKPTQSLPVSKLITAMILAGGSTAVNKIFVAVGLRSIPVPPPDVKPPETKAWVAVMVKQKVSTGRIHVGLKDSGVAGATDPTPIAGTACAGAPNLFALLFRNRNRFPANGGYEVIPGHLYEVSVSGEDSTGASKSVTVGKFVFANRAIVDFDVTL